MSRSDSSPCEAAWKSPSAWSARYCSKACCARAPSSVWSRSAAISCKKLESRSSVLPPSTLSTLTGLRVAVTNGTSGLGLALVEGGGADVAFVARNARGVKAVVRDVPGAHGIDGDVSRKEETHALAIRITVALGGLDVLINNASSLGPVPLALLADTECEALELALATNLVGPFRLTKALPRGPRPPVEGKFSILTNGDRPADNVCRLTVAYA